MRYSLSHDRNETTYLRKELENAERYLDIEKVRFGKRLKYVSHIPEACLDAPIPNLILQPLLENAIKHGIGPRPTPGRITIRSRRAGGLLELIVQDDGVGLSAARLSDFNRGVGLSNTRSRLEHLYGSLHRFEFRQPAEGGLLVSMAIPLATVDEGDVGGEVVEGAA